MPVWRLLRQLPLLPLMPHLLQIPPLAKSFGPIFQVLSCPIFTSWPTKNTKISIVTLLMVRMKWVMYVPVIAIWSRRSGRQYWLAAWGVVGVVTMLWILLIRRIPKPSGNLPMPIWVIPTVIHKSPSLLTERGWFC